MPPTTKISLFEEKVSGFHCALNVDSQRPVRLLGRMLFVGVPTPEAVGADSSRSSVFDGVAVTILVPLGEK